MVELHSALKTDIVSRHHPAGIELLVVKLQSSKEDVRYSLHACPNSFSTYGMQTSDLLAILGFTHTRCAFFSGGQCYSLAIEETFELENFGNAFLRSFENFHSAARHLESCGIFLPQPEGWVFHGGRAPGDRRGQTRTSRGDGHTSPQREQMKTSEDQYLQYVFSWIVGGTDKGWTTHYRPKHLPISPEMEAVFSFIGLRSFQSCPEFDFEPCHWLFTPFDSRGDGFFESNAEVAHRWFDAHAEHFALGIEQLLAAQREVQGFGMRILPAFRSRPTAGGSMSPVIRPARTGPSAIPPIGVRTGGANPAVQPTDRKFKYDLAVSYAGPQQHLAEALATKVVASGFEVFFDLFYPEQLWGKDLAVFFDDIYRIQSRYCVIFVSPDYVDRMWTTVERRSALARFVQEKGQDYILPIVVEPAELPGLPPTIGHIALGSYTIDQAADILIRKLRE